MHAYLLNLHIFNNENCKQIKQLNVLESKYKLTLFLKRNVNIEFIFSSNVYKKFDKIGLWVYGLGLGEVLLCEEEKFPFNSICYYFIAKK